MNILAVDTSTQVMVASLKTQDKLEEVNLTNTGMQHSEILMPTIISLCEKASIKPTDIDLMICTRGPGSFTGLRIGMATLKGLSFGSKKPIVSVSTLMMHSHTVKNFDGLVVPVIDAKKARYYVGAFECKNGSVNRVLDDTDGSEEDLSSVIGNYKNILVVGPDKEVFAEKIKARFPNVSVTTQTNDTVSVSTSLIDLGLAQFKEKGADDIGQGPVYLRKSDAEVALEEREKNNG